MEIIIYAYFGLNTFIAGQVFEWMSVNGKIKSKFDAVMTTVMIILAGIPVFIVAAILTRND